MSSEPESTSLWRYQQECPQRTVVATGVCRNHRDKGLSPKHLLVLSALPFWLKDEAMGFRPGIIVSMALSV